MSRDDPREWLNRARNNVRLARLRDHSDYLDDLCHHAQQAAEKAIKAVMIARQVRFPYVHDLLELLDVLDLAGFPVPENVTVAAAELNNYFDARYPKRTEIDDAAYTRALAHAACVIEWAAPHIVDADVVREVTVVSYPQRKLVHASGAPDAELMTDIIARIVAAVAPEQIILFGSAARGTMAERSDLDLMVVMTSACDDRVAQRAIQAALRGCGIRIDLVVATQEIVERYGHSWALVYRPALEEGVVMYDRPAADGCDVGVVES